MAVLAAVAAHLDRDVARALPQLEAGRARADDGAVVPVGLGAWPASTIDRAGQLVQDRRARLVDLDDLAPAAENQVVPVSSNRTGVQGRLRSPRQAEVVGPGGDAPARTGAKGGMATPSVDVAHEVGRARRRLHHLTERVPGAYRRP